MEFSDDQIRHAIATVEIVPAVEMRRDYVGDRLRECRERVRKFKELGAPTLADNERRLLADMESDLRSAMTVESVNEVIASFREPMTIGEFIRLVREARPGMFLEEERMLDDLSYRVHWKVVDALLGSADVQDAARESVWRIRRIVNDALRA